MSAPSIKPTHKSIAAYYQALADVHAYGVTSESATERAFSNLLATTGNSHGWTLIPKQPVKLGGGKTIIPDGTLRDLFNLPRGYWEAKDTSDDLDDEIQKKIKKKYPLGNIIFEDTRQAVLFQSRKEFARFDLTKPQQIADLLNQFFAYVEPNIEGFEQAVGEFQERVPELAEGLNEKIKQAHASNKNFQKTFRGAKGDYDCRLSLRERSSPTSSSYARRP